MTTGLENQDQNLDNQDQDLTNVDTPDITSDTSDGESTETQTLDEKRWEYQQARADKAEAEAQKIKDDLAKKDQLIQQLLNSQPQTQQSQQAETPLTPPQMPVETYDDDAMKKYYADVNAYNNAVFNAKAKELDQKITQIQELEKQRIQADETARARAGIMQQLLSEGATEEEARLTMETWVDKASERSPRDYLEATRTLMELQGHKVDRQLEDYKKQKELNNYIPTSVSGGVNEQQTSVSFTARKENKVSSGHDAMAKFRP
jgi:hypothetical protein